jgi:hypothetical protein
MKGFVLMWAFVSPSLYPKKDLGYMIIFVDPDIDI